MMARRDDAVWLAPHTMSRNTANAPFGPSRRASRRAVARLAMAATPSPPANSGALGERDLFRGYLVCCPGVNPPRCGA